MKHSIWIAAVLLAACPVLANVPETVDPEEIVQRIELKTHELFAVENLRVEVMPFEDQSYTNRGRFQWISLGADSLQHQNMRFRELYLKVFDIQLDLERIYADFVEVGNRGSARSVLWARVDEEAMNAALHADSDWARSNPIKDIQVDFMEGQVKFTGKLAALANSDVELVGTLKIRDKRYLDFELISAKVNDVPWPVGPLRPFIRRINPLFDMREMPLSPTMERLTITTEYILVQG